MPEEGHKLGDSFLLKFCFSNSMTISVSTCYSKVNSGLLTCDGKPTLKMQLKEALSCGSTALSQTGGQGK